MCNERHLEFSRMFGELDSNPLTFGQKTKLENANLFDISNLAGDGKTAEQYRAKAASIREKMQKLCWDPNREFFLHVYQHDEEKDGARIKAMSRTYESGKYIGNAHGREEIGFVPWQFNLPDALRHFLTHVRSRRSLLLGASVSKEARALLLAGSSHSP